MPIAWPDAEVGTTAPDAAPMPEPVAETSGPFVVQVEKLKPVAGPVRISQCEVSTNPRKTIEADMVTLARLVRALNNAFSGDTSAYSQCQPIADEIADVRERLRLLGAHVTVVSTPAPAEGRAVQ